jgi:hypothetical protein
MGADLQSEHERYLVENTLNAQSCLITQQISKHLHAFERRLENSSCHGHPFPELEKL